MPIHIQDIYLHELYLQVEANLNPDAPQRMNGSEEHSPDVLRRINRAQSHTVFYETSAQNDIVCNVQGSMRHSFVTRPSTF